MLVGAGVGAAALAYRFGFFGDFEAVFEEMNIEEADLEEAGSQQAGGLSWARPIRPFRLLLCP